MKKLKIIINYIKLIFSEIPNFKKIRFVLYGGFTLWLLLFSYVKVDQVAVKYNVFTSNITIDTLPGFNISPPWILLTKVTISPKKLCVDCSCRVLNCKLVCINKEHLIELFYDEGFSYIWWKNRLSFNISNQNEYRGQDYIIRGYAYDYDTSRHKFIKIIKE